MHILYEIVQVWRHPNWNKPDTHAHTQTNRRLVVPRAHERIGRAWNSSWNSSFFIAFLFSSHQTSVPPCLFGSSIPQFSTGRWPCRRWAIQKSRETVKHSHRCFFPGWLTPAMLGWQGVEQPTCPCLEPHGSRNQKYQRMNETDKLHLEEWRRRPKGIYQNCEQSALLEHPNVGRKLHVKHNWH